jgi:hypothetical protein
MQLFAMTAMLSDMGNLYSVDNRGNPLRPKDIDVKATNTTYTKWYERLVY